MTTNKLYATLLCDNSMHRAIFHSPLHDIEVIVKNEGVTSVKWISPEYSAKLTIICKLQAKPSQMENIHLNDTSKWFEALWNMKTLPQIPDLSFDDATEFQMNVWNELVKTAPGTTITYQQLAGLAGSKNASRAVGSAMAANPITILVPCHRVIQTNGKLGNYSGYGGDETKKWLLELEANSAN